MNRPDRRPLRRPRFTAMLDPPSPAGGGGRFRQVRLMGLVVLLALTLVAIYSLRRAGGADRPAVLVTPFQAGTAGPEARVAEELTDRLAARISRLPEVRIVLLAPGAGESPDADLQITGSVARDGEDLRVRVTLRRLPEGDPRVLLDARLARPDLGPLVGQVAGALATDLRRGTP